MSHKVFISYAAADQRVADEVCCALEAGGIGCWIASRDIPPGVNFEEAIEDAVAACSAVILILSNDANASPYVLSEVKCAFDHKPPKQIIPFRIGPVSYSKSLIFYLRSKQWIDASAPPLTAHLGKLVKHLCTHFAEDEALHGDQQIQRPPPAGSKPGAGGLLAPRSDSWVFVAGAALLLVAVFFILRSDLSAGDYGVAARPAAEVVARQRATQTLIEYLLSELTNEERTSQTVVEYFISELTNKDLSKYREMNRVIVKFQSRYLTLTGFAPTEGCREAAVRLSRKIAKGYFLEIAGRYSQEVAERYDHLEGVNNQIIINDIEAPERIAKNPLFPEPAPLCREY